MIDWKTTLVLGLTLVASAGLLLWYRRFRAIQVFKDAEIMRLQQLARDKAFRERAAAAKNEVKEDTDDEALSRFNKR